eukprot:NODE_4030_length_501_cov_1051.497788_g3341_i2.p1 GENE.NODE_4030_length_501_cov_1051.497788_g3341_i2~~NODE_4030_length_501_cov_1051.497788_g3341_i2.p1  ORF type:complete len:99 (+),score=24.86 NODE_4030_length_501_cov_1051.497788_g3341_i2:46-342(+)
MVHSPLKVIEAPLTKKSFTPGTDPIPKITISGKSPSYTAKKYLKFPAFALSAKQWDGKLVGPGGFPLGDAAWPVLKNAKKKQWVAPTFKDPKARNFRL